MNRRRVFELFFGRLDRNHKWFQSTDILVVGGVLLVIAWIAPVCHVDRIAKARAIKACANGVDEKGAGDDIPNWDPDQNCLHHESYTNEFPLGLWLRRLVAR